MSGYLVKTQFYRPGLYRTSNDPAIPEMGATVTEFIIPPLNYTELQLKCLIDRISITISNYIDSAVVEAYRPIIDSREDNYVHLYILHQGKTVVPLSDNMVIPNDEQFIPANQCMIAGAEMLTFQRFAEIVAYWEDNYPDYAVLVCRPIRTSKGITPSWWIPSIVQRLDLEWVRQRLTSHPDYGYVNNPQLAVVDGALLMRVDYKLSNNINRDTGHRDYINRIVNMAADILLSLYDQGTLADVEDELKTNLQLKLHPSGLYVCGWNHILLMDATRSLDRYRTYGVTYVPLSPLMVAEGSGLTDAMMISDNRVMVCTGGDQEILHQLNSRDWVGIKG